MNSEIMVQNTIKQIKTDGDQKPKDYLQIKNWEQTELISGDGNKQFINNNDAMNAQQQQKFYFEQNNVIDQSFQKTAQKISEEFEYQKTLDQQIKLQQQIENEEKFKDFQRKLKKISLNQQNKDQNFQDYYFFNNKNKNKNYATKSFLSNNQTNQSINHFEKSKDNEFKPFNQERDKLGYLISPYHQQQQKINLKKYYGKKSNVKVINSVQNNETKKMIQVGNIIFFDKGYQLNGKFNKQKRQQLINEEVQGQKKNFLYIQQNKSQKMITQNSQNIIDCSYRYIDGVKQKVSSQRTTSYPNIFQNLCNKNNNNQDKNEQFIKSNSNILIKNFDEVQSNKKKSGFIQILSNIEQNKIFEHQQYYNKQKIQNASNHEYNKKINQNLDNSNFLTSKGQIINSKNRFASLNNSIFLNGSVTNKMNYEKFQLNENQFNNVKKSVYLNDQQSNGHIQKYRTSDNSFQSDINTLEKKYKSSSKIDKFHKLKKFFSLKKLPIIKPIKSSNPGQGYYKVNDSLTRPNIVSHIFKKEEAKEQKNQYYSMLSNINTDQERMKNSQKLKHEANKEYDGYQREFTKINKEIQKQVQLERLQAKGELKHPSPKKFHQYYVDNDEIQQIDKQFKQNMQAIKKAYKGFQNKVKIDRIN
ncbi:hypothetical protein PPERSA_05854 [Pseudocohnilembus persalinus]|uniref:Uncharacterized protein n=1 Tax=Pseudocohnilembus persalinus TaxID=266149 RepID=A0A0V0R3Y5_PSEPJ|nr:hypothetical protein PPERSA_05854 [Pseudocohnilembus persalinus]|eukprot:KRX09185.1 hypothetical protein PPERSA_05854 [Pseudocohnilembus persalinus]